MVRLNLGCGDRYAPDWLNIDADSNDKVTPDLVLDIVEGLPFPDGAVERVYLGHVLEHLPFDEVVPTLIEVRRVLAPGGLGCIVGPDVGKTLRDDRWKRTIATVLHGVGRWEHDRHLWTSTGEATVLAARQAGFVAHLIEPAEVDGTWPVVSREGWQFAVTLEVA